MLTKIEQYVIDKVRDKRNQLGLTQVDLAIKSGTLPDSLRQLRLVKKIRNTILIIYLPLLKR